MVEIQVVYAGELHSQARHVPSGTELPTDAPKDNQGRGESFSPTDLVATALGTCMLTTMGIVAKRNGWKLEGARARVEKHMVADPQRRVGRLPVRIEMPGKLPEDSRAALEHAAHTCPVRLSIRADIDCPVSFVYPD